MIILEKIVELLNEEADHNDSLWRQTTADDQESLVYRMRRDIFRDIASIIDRVV